MLPQIFKMLHFCVNFYIMCYFLTYLSYVKLTQKFNRLGRVKCVKFNTNFPAVYYDITWARH